MQQEEKQYPVLYNPLAHLAFPLQPQGENTIGCSPHARLVLYQPGIEREHASLSMGSQGWQLLVKGISGVYLNGKHLLPSFLKILLHPGDVLQLGNIPLLFTEVSLNSLEEPIVPNALAILENPAMKPTTGQTDRSSNAEVIRWKPPGKIETTQEHIATETLRLKPSRRPISPFVAKRFFILGLSLVLFLLLTYLLITGKLRSLREVWPDPPPLPPPLAEPLPAPLGIDWQPCGFVTIARFPASPDIEAAQEQALSLFQAGKYKEAEAHYAAYVVRRLTDLSLQPVAFQNIVRYNSWLYRWFHWLHQPNGNLEILQKEIEVVYHWTQSSISDGQTLQQFLLLRNALLEKISHQCAQK